jgi:hypothetical protein
MALLQSGVDIAAIALWLGHAKNRDGKGSRERLDFLSTFH